MGGLCRPVRLSNPALAFAFGSVEYFWLAANVCTGRQCLKLYFFRITEFEIGYAMCLCLNVLYPENELLLKFL